MAQGYSQPETVAQRILDEYNDISANKLVEVHHTNATFYKIDTGKAVPIRVKPMRVSLKENNEILNQLYLLSVADKIEPSIIPWRLNLLVVPKADGSLRRCINFQLLNQMTIKDVQSLPNNIELIDEFQVKKVFSIVDLCSGYFQTPLT